MSGRSPSQSWVHDPALRRVWGVVGDRFSERGLQAHGRVVVGGLDRAERHAVSALLGHSVTTGRVSVELAALDASLLERSGIGGLAAVLEAVTGSAPRDRPADRAQRADDREAPFALARELVPDAPWRAEWLDGVRRSGLLGRASDAPTAVRRAAAALARLPAGPNGTSRTELATATGGGAHALDEGSTSAALVLRALAARAEEPVPVTAAARRALWERSGVRVDLVSTTCLTLGLRATERLDAAADAGDPVHLTGWDLRRLTLRVPDRVLVCENPRVLEAVAERYGARHPVVCTSGQPVLVVLDVLRALTGAELRYHGDFDWPGVAIAHRLMVDIGVAPWRMGADDYTAALAGQHLPLSGVPVEPAWDAELGAAMRGHGIAVHEEAVLADLLGGLEGVGE